MHSFIYKIASLHLAVRKELKGNKLCSLGNFRKVTLSSLLGADGLLVVLLQLTGLRVAETLEDDI